MLTIRVKNPRGTPQRIPLHEALGIAPGGASPRGSTYYKTFQHCPREFFLREHLRLVPATPPDPLTVGLLWHHCLEQYYRSIMTHQKSTPRQPSSPAWLWGGANEGADRAFVALNKVAATEGYFEIGGIVRRMFEYYLDAFDRRDRLEVLAVEETLAYWGEDPYTCRADLIVEDFDRGGMWFWEHKSARALTEDLLSAYDMDLQILGEWWLISNVVDLESYPPLRGVVVNITTKPSAPDKGEPKTLRHDVCPSPGHVMAFEHTVGTRKIMLEAAERAGWPKYLGNCAGAPRGYTKCAYYDLCHQRPQLTATQLKRVVEQNDLTDFPLYALAQGNEDDDFNG